MSHPIPLGMKLPSQMVDTPSSLRRPKRAVKLAEPAPWSTGEPWGWPKSLPLRPSPKPRRRDEV